MLLALLLPAFAAEPIDLAPARRAAIRTLEAHVRAAPTAANLLALAELWQRDAEALELAALADQVARYDACHDRPGCDLSAVELDLSAATRSRAKATVRYRMILRDFPDSPEVDAAAYGLGWAWRAMGLDALGDAAFTWLVAARPESTYVNDAWLLVGERAFEAWDAQWARQAYSSVASTDDPRRSWAMHRLAWSYYRLGDYASAIDTLKDVVVAASTAPKPLAPGTVDMSEEALKDLVRFYADSGEMDEGGHCYGNRARVRDMLRRWGDTYAEQGKFESAIQMWRRLIAEEPTSPEVPVFQARIVDAYHALGRAQETVFEVDRLIRNVDALPPSPANEALLERALRNVALGLHRWGRTGDDADRITLAAELYAFHSSRFPMSEYAPDLAWAWAVALEDLGQSAEAAAHYSALIVADPAGRYAQDAAGAIERVEGR